MIKLFPDALMVSLGILAATWVWLRRWGGLGLIPLGILERVVPIPGGMDLATAVLAASHRNLWLYYALMATAGSVIGGYLTYRVARRGGKEALNRIPADKLELVERLVQRWGFGTVLVSALLPPPIPIVPFLLGAGALNYPVRKFIAALTIARTVRFTILSYLASIYGRQILRLLGDLTLPLILSIVAVLIIAGITFYIIRRIQRRRSQA